MVRRVYGCAFFIFYKPKQMKVTTNSRNQRLFPEKTSQYFKSTTNRITKLLITLILIHALAINKAQAHKC